jgi:hypothetical protein
MAYLHFPMRNVYTPVSQKEACLKKRTNQEANAKEKKLRRHAFPRRS